MLNNLIINDIYYDKFIWDESRYYVLIGGRGSGKSYAAAQKIIVRCLEEKGSHKFLIVRKTLPALKRSCWALINALLNKLEIPHEVNKTELFIKIGTHTLLFVSLDDPEKIKSIEGITGTWIEEANELTEAEFRNIDLCLRGLTPNYKQHILSLNPINELLWINRSFCFDINLETEFYKQTDNKTILKTTYIDNHYLDEEYVKVLQSLKSQNTNLYRISALGLWGGNKGLIYTNYNTMYILPDSNDIIYGVDFGYNNPTAVVEIRIKDDEYYIKQLVYETNLTNTDLLELLKSLDVNKNNKWYFDCAEPARIEEFRRNGYNAWEADKDVNKGIDFVKSQKLHIDENSTDVLKELKTYFWQETKDGSLIDKPVKEWDHSMDAIRYAIYTNHNIIKPYISNVIGVFEYK